MTYLVRLVPGDRWWPSRETLDQGHPIEQHLTAMNRLHEEGLLLGGGTLAEHGAVALLHTCDETFARTLMDTDPAVTSGLLRPHLELVVDYPTGSAAARAMR
jgi:hypothetical protein